MKNKFSVILVFLMTIPLISSAQTNDFGIWTTIEATKKFRRWDLGVEAELRTRENTSEVQRWSLEADIAFRVFKPLQTGISYKYISINDAEYNDFQPRQRYSFYVKAKKKVGDFTFSLKEQAQRTIKDERDRIKDDNTYDTYRINPEWIWRNRIQVAYNIPHFPVNPSFSVETFYQLNNPEGNTFDALRFTLSWKYKLSKHHKLEIYGLFDHEINVSDPVNTWVTGISYTFLF
jgi:hypothetical protein